MANLHCLFSQRTKMSVSLSSCSCFIFTICFSEQFTKGYFCFKKNPRVNSCVSFSPSHTHSLSCLCLAVSLTRLPLLLETLSLLSSSRTTKSLIQVSNKEAYFLLLSPTASIFLQSPSAYSRISLGIHFKSSHLVRSS